METKHPVILAAGGTGGHIFPAEALAEALLAHGERVVLVTDKRFAHFKTGVFSQLEVCTIHAGSPSGGGLHQKVIGAAGLVVGIFQARMLLSKLKPKAVVGFGGYPSFPTVFAAARRVPTIIHEQNSVLGRANRMLAGRVDVIATSFPGTQMIESADESKVVMTGNPVRSSVRALKDIPYPALAQDGKMHVLVTGGSQGASVFSDVVPKAVALLPANLRSRVRIDQQCRGEGELTRTREIYAEIGVNADLSTFFVDVPARLAGSHLVVARSGASTVSELAVAGRPAILVPLPSSMDNHQYYNANALEDVGGGWVMAQEGFTPEALSARLEAFLTAPDTLAKAAISAKTIGHPDAAQRLAELVLKLVGGEQITGGKASHSLSSSPDIRHPSSALEAA
ncbi:MAG: undecaprenyldiphospho-muramoylpentapeptide beta-N-acetylglucosaminyltransferase [Rickettsiales bacterium]|jgi:UDP-N-acetylglucosamine--N-acetylmuramyl-(pentapeptide) pyrophosphoryl-undecaprenol N-acetylglucosamine transferase|nr:undecaprenyldiphospho-muramoylpentapeptide beta-N-acetylglucosaminyltransferase [Rickettsiales bacterium]